jgi:hypothetical protein
MMLAWPVLVVVAATVFFTLFVRIKDIPVPEPVSPTKHLEERKAAIYENLRDLQFEFRVGKLSDEDYQQTKVALQKELAGVIAEMEKIMAAVAERKAAGKPIPATEAPKVKAASTPAAKPDPLVCPHCGAKFAKPMKFCGECGKAMS